MRKYQAIVIILLFISGLISCGKKEGSFPSSPYLEYKSISIDKADSIYITCSFRDKEGDIQNKIWYTAYNITNPGDSNDVYVSFQMPGVPAQKNMEGDILVKLSPNGQDFTATASDSLYFELYLEDMKGHISDTVRTDTVQMHP